MVKIVAISISFTDYHSIEIKIFFLREVQHNEWKLLSSFVSHMLVSRSTDCGADNYIIVNNNGIGSDANSNGKQV